MADKILGSDIVDQSVEVELLKVDKLMDNLLDKFIKTAAGAKELNTALKNAGSTNEVTKGVNGYSASLSELDKIKRDLVKANEKLIASQTLEAQLLSELKSRQVEENKTTREFIRDKKMQEGSIDQLNAKLVQMKRAYTELAQAERDAAKGQQMLAHIQATRTEVGKLEATMGMYHKNVGNYTNATFQMTQVLREVPNFAQSAEIGIRSLSNNLPMLADAFQQVRKDAGGTGPALKIFANSMLSFSSIFPLVLTFFIKYQQEIFDFITGTTKAEKETKKLTSALDDSQKAFVSAAESAGAERVQMLQLYSIATDVNLAMKTRLDATNELQRLYPSYLKNISDESIMAGQAADAFDRLNGALLQKAVFKGFEAQAEEQGKGLSALIMEREALQQRYEKLLGGDKKTTQVGGQTLYDITSSDIKSEQAALSTQAQAVKTQLDFLDQNISLTESTMMRTIQTMKKYADASNTIDSLDNTKDKKEKKEKDPFKMDVPNLEPTEEELKNIDNYYKRMSDEIKKLWNQYFNSQEFKDALSLDEKELMGDMNKLTSRDNLSDAEAFDLNALLMGRGKNKKTDAKEREAEIRNYFNIVNQGLSSIQVITDTLKQIEEERFRLQEEQMNTYYDAEEERIKQSGKSQAEQEEALMKLAAQREAQQKKIDADRAQAQRKAAARQKVIDIAQVIANTALAVTAALTDKTLGPIGRAAAAIAAGITGTAQLAAIIATPLPQYKDGTDSHKGGLAVVGDGGEHELIVEPSGKSYLSPNKSTIMNLPAKTKVIPQKKLLQMVTDATHVSLANTSTPITEGMYINEMIAQYDKLASEVKGLKEVMIGKNMQTNIYSDYDHNLHVQRNRF